MKSACGMRIAHRLAIGIAERPPRRVRDSDAKLMAETRPNDR